MSILDVQSDLFFTIFKISQIWPKITQNGDFLNFSTLAPFDGFSGHSGHLFEKMVKNSNLCFFEWFWEKWLYVWQNGAQKGVRWLIWLCFSSRNITQVFWKTIPETLKILQTGYLKKLLYWKKNLERFNEFQAMDTTNESIVNSDLSFHCDIFLEFWPIEITD